MIFAGGFLWKLDSSSSSALVKGVPNVEPALLLGKGMEETLVDVVDVSACSAATFALYLVMVNQDTVDVFWTRWTRNGQWFIRRWVDEENTKMSDVVWAETKFQFHLCCETRLEKRAAPLR